MSARLSNQVDGDISAGAGGPSGAAGLGRLPLPPGEEVVERRVLLRLALGI